MTHDTGEDTAMHAPTTMRSRRLRRAEILRVSGAAALLGAAFLPWFATGNESSQIAGRAGAGLSVTGWEALPAVALVLAVAALVPLLVAHVLLPGGEVSWRPGELTAVTASVATVAVLMCGVIDRPGTPSGQIALAWGWYVALAGALAMVAGAALRTSEHTSRKPPGT